MDYQILLLKTLADPTRLKLFKLILHEELCVCELQEILQVSQPAVSQHIAKLKAAGLVRERRAGMWTYYRGDRRRATDGLQGVMDLLTADPAAIPGMAELLRRRQQLDRVEMCPARKGGATL